MKEWIEKINAAAAQYSRPPTYSWDASGNIFTNHPIQIATQNVSELAEVYHNAVRFYVHCFTL